MYEKSVPWKKYIENSSEQMREFLAEELKNPHDS